MTGRTAWPTLRFRLVWLMVIVAFIALNCAALRAGFERRSPSRLFLCLGCLPMANILAAGFLLGVRYPGIRRFLVGFETFGAMSLGVLVLGILLVFGNSLASRQPFSSY